MDVIILTIILCRNGWNKNISKLTLDFCIYITLYSTKIFLPTFNCYHSFKLTVNIWCIAKYYQPLALLTWINPQIEQKYIITLIMILISLCTANVYLVGGELNKDYYCKSTTPNFMFIIEAVVSFSALYYIYKQNIKSPHSKLQINSLSNVFVWSLMISFASSMAYMVWRTEWAAFVDRMFRLYFLSRLVCH